MGAPDLSMGGASSQDMWVDHMLKIEDIDSDKLWKEYDKDESGHLSKGEAKQVVLDIANAMVEAYGKGVDQAWDKMTSEEKAMMEALGGKKMLEAMKPVIEELSKQLKTQQQLDVMF